MNGKRKKIKRPGTLADVAINSYSLEEFGYNLRDWQHEIRDKWRGPKDFSRRLQAEPEWLENKFQGGDVAGAYLEAYALWLADRVGVPRVEWAREKKRKARDPWFSGFKRASLLRDAPAHFIERNLFTIPDASFLERRLSRTSKPKANNLTRAVRKKTQLTQAGLAALLGVSLGTIRNWEQGRNEPNRAAATLLRLLDRHPADLITHRFPMEKVDEAYSLKKKKKNG